MPWQVINEASRTPYWFSENASYSYGKKLDGRKFSVFDSRERAEEEARNLERLGFARKAIVIKAEG